MNKVSCLNRGHYVTMTYLGDKKGLYLFEKITDTEIGQ